jgi:hypothetical protein
MLTMLHVQLSVQHRDEEIGRLSQRLATGTEVNHANMALRNETNESIILSLNQQVRDVAVQQCLKRCTSASFHDGRVLPCRAR